MRGIVGLVEGDLLLASVVGRRVVSSVVGWPVVAGVSAKHNGKARL